MSMRFTAHAACALALGLVLAFGSGGPQSGVRADARHQLDRALDAVAAGNLDAAISAAGQVPAADPWHVDALFCAAWAHAEKGDHQAAADAYRKVVAARPNDARAWNNLGSVLDDLTRYDEALKAYDRSIAADPEYAASHNNRGVTLEKLGEGEAAAESFRTAINLDNDYAAPHNNLGAWYYETGRRDRAAQHWARAAELDPSYVAPIVNSAVLDFEGDKPSVAEVRLRTLVGSGRADASVWFNLGIFAYKRGDLERAQECLEQADAMRPEHAETLNNLGVLYFMSKKDRAAERSLRQCTTLDPSMARAWDNLGLVLYRGERFDEALDAFEREVALSPNGSLAHYNLGCAQAALGDVETAAKSFERAADLDAANVDAAHNLFVLLSERKDRDPARELQLLQNIVREDPDHAQAHLSLGRFFQSEPQFRDLKKAYAHYERYVKTTPSSDEGVRDVVSTMQAIRRRIGK